MANLLSTALQGYGIYDQFDRLGDIGKNAVEGTSQLAQEAQAGTQFKPYTVTTGTGTSSVGPAGGYTSQLSPELQALQQQAYGGAAGAFSQTQPDPYLQGLLTDFRAGQTDPRAYTQVAGNKTGAFGASGDFMNQSLQGTGSREQDVYDRIRATQMPEEERARLGLDSRLFAQGRSGVASNTYGGTPEDFAYAKAQAEARNNASLSAIQQAQAEQAQQGQLAGMFGQLGQSGAGLQQNLASQNINDILGITQGATQQQLGQANLGSGLLQAGLFPEAQQLNALGQSTNLANLAQTGQIAGQNLASQLGLGGLQSAVNTEKVRAELMGRLFGTLGGAASDSGFDPISGGLDWLGGLFSGGGGATGDFVPANGGNFTGLSDLDLSDYFARQGIDPTADPSRAGRLTHD